MENSEIQNKIINLGKLFVQELKLEPGVDTFSRWIAHYLAEKISLTEQTEGKEKEAAENECFDIILKLWQHRYSLPSGSSPFRNFEPIFNLLLKLNPEREEPFFFNAISNQELSDSETDNLDYKSVEKWTNIAKEIDKTARIWIEYALSQAASIAKNDRTKEWIENALYVSDNDDTSIISKLLDKNLSFDIEDYDKNDLSKRYAVEKIKKRMEQLQKFSKLNDMLLNSFESDLEKFVE